MNGDVERGPHVNGQAVVGIFKEKAAVLMTAFFGNVGLGEDFDATADGRGQLYGEILVLHQDTIAA